MKKLLKRFGFATAVAGLLFAGTPASAATASEFSVQASSCAMYTELCYDTTNAISSTVKLRISTSNGYTGTPSYLITRSNGTTLCSGKMPSLNSTVSCNVGTYRGSVSARIAKGPGPISTIALLADA